MSDMQIIAATAHKGGVGKTTLITNLAACVAISGKRTAIIDLDEQGSAYVWCEKRERIHKDRPQIFAINPNLRQLAREVETARSNKLDFLFIDTPPKNAEHMGAAANIADLVLVPTAPYGHEAETIDGTVANLKTFPRPKKFFVVNNFDPRSSVGEEFAEFLRTKFVDQGIAVAPVLTPHRAVLRNTAMDGLSAFDVEPGGAAARQIENLVEWIERTLGVEREPERTKPTKSRGARQLEGRGG